MAHVVNRAKRPKPTSVGDFFLHMLVTWFFLGDLPRAPGTWGTLGAIPFVIVLFLLSPVAMIVVVLLLTFVSVFLCHMYEERQKFHDPRHIVIDEVVGYSITMVYLPATWSAIITGFVLFRLLDIVKPPPIRQLDRKMSGGLGTVSDDVAAGIMASVLMQLMNTHTPWLTNYPLWN